MEEFFFNGRRVLFIAPIFFGYENDIADALRRKGAEVDFLCDRPFNSPFLKAVTRVRRSLIQPISMSYYTQEIEGFGRSHYDYIFILLGECINSAALAKLRSIYPRAKLVWYMWDSLRNRPDLHRNLDFFDHCLTFDRQDAREFGMQYRALFFPRKAGEANSSNNKIRHDISFIGTAHSDRFKIINEVKQSLDEEISFYNYLFLQAPWVYRAYKIFNRSNFKNAKKKDFEYTPLNRDRVYQVFQESFAVLDIEHPQQSGMTMRTFETVGAEKKLITTNRSIVDEDFFNPANVIVFERGKNIDISRDFFKTPYEKIDEKLYRKYSIDGWIDEIFSH